MISGTPIRQMCRAIRGGPESAATQDHAQVAGGAEAREGREDQGGLVGLAIERAAGAVEGLPAHDEAERGRAQRHDQRGDLEAAHLARPAPQASPSRWRPGRRSAGQRPWRPSGAGRGATAAPIPATISIETRNTLPAGAVQPPALARKGIATPPAAMPTKPAADVEVEDGGRGQVHNHRRLGRDVQDGHDASPATRAPSAAGGGRLNALGKR